MYIDKLKDQEIEASKTCPECYGIIFSSKVCTACNNTGKVSFHISFYDLANMIIDIYEERKERKHE